MTLPILVNHDHRAEPIGFVEWRDGRITFEFSQPVEPDEVFEIFGNVGVQFTVMEYDENGKMFVRAGIIFEFSSP